MIDISEVINDPDFTQPFQINRMFGSFVNEGEWLDSPVTLERIGVIQPTKANDALQFLPEGERQSNAITIYCTQDVLMGDGQNQRSDTVLWNGSQYRVAYAKPWQQNGYWFAIATGMAI
ncbi:MAG: hypothetical protein V4536_08820 [Pseudomonadota bacterium]